MDISLLQEYFSDLKEGYPLIIAVFAASFVISLLFMVFIRFCAGCFVWSFILLFIILQLLVGTFFFLINEVKFLQDLFNYNDFPDNLKDRTYQLVIAGVCWAISVITVLVVCCMRKQIRICKYL